MSIAKIIIDGVPKGTAWLIHAEHVATAAHCVGLNGSKAMVHFLDLVTGEVDQGIEATVVVSNSLLDAALLKLSSPRTDLVVLPVTECGPSNGHPDWISEGFPAAAEGMVSSFGFSGSVQLMHANLQRGGKNASVIQLECRHGTDRLQHQFMVDRDGLQIHMLGGVSGSAIRLPDRGDRVVAIVRCAMSPLGASVIYACPIWAVWSEFTPHLPGVVLHKWLPTVGMVRPDPNQGSVLSNIDEDLIAAAWKDNVITDITVDLPWDSASPLIPAILRIILHQPGIQRLRVRNPAAWNARLVSYADAWIALERFNPQEVVNPAIDCAQPCAESGTSFSSVSAVAEVIHSTCDRFVLEYLDQRLGLMFELTQPRDIAGYDIASDVLHQMKVTWAAWFSALRADAALLHHFLALMLTHQSGHDSTIDPSPGAGPLTMEDCILPATIFGLAIAPFLPTTLAPKRPQPGNVGQNATSGHACGILAIKRQRLEFGLRGKQWQTQVVLLQGLRCSAEVLQASTTTLLSGNHSQRPTLNRPAPSALVISRDIETETAIGAGAQQLRYHLANLTAKHVQIQADYETSAIPST